MTTIVPLARPEMTREYADELVRAHGVKGPALLGRRGYYRDSMGAPGKNERGLYDDAIVLVTPTCFLTFNANTDPSYTRNGMAVLQPGVWDYKLGTHGLSRPEEKRYMALVQAGPVTVLRDGGKLDSGWFGLNVHRGGYQNTGSEGCQTIYPDQWPSFITTVESEMQRHRLATIPYVLTVRADVP